MKSFRAILASNGVSDGIKFALNFRGRVWKKFRLHLRNRAIYALHTHAN
jgi:hypothetical protein